MKNLLLCCSLMMLLACEESHELGSDCPNGVCPRAVGRAEPACLVRESSMVLGVDYGDDAGMPDSPPDPGIYLESGTVDFGTRRVYWKFGDDVVLKSGETLRACGEVPYLQEPDADDEGAQRFKAAVTSGESANPLVCLVKQATRTANGEFETDGWYIEDSHPSGRRPLRYSPGVGLVPHHITIWTTRIGAESIARDGTLKETDPGICSLPEDSAGHEEDVGRSCSLTSSEEGGYGESEIVVEAGSTQCATGACVVYQLAGDPQKSCGKKNSDLSCRNQRDAPSDEEVAKRVYCSCRCDAPEGDPGELCTCKAGFTCAPALTNAPPGIRGSYCLKDGTVSSVAF